MTQKAANGHKDNNRLLCSTPKCAILAADRNYAKSDWRRVVKNIGWADQNIGEKSGKNDKCMGVSQLLGARARAAP